MRTWRLLLHELSIVVLLGTFFVLPVVARQDSHQDPTATADESRAEREKAMRYHEALRKRPTTGFLFDRFFDAWLEFSTIAELETFLRDEAAQTTATSDQLLLAFFFAKQGDDVRALEQFRTALATDPGNAVAWYEKGVTEARTLDFDTALADLGRASEAKPDKELALRIAQLQGSILVRNGQVEEAIETWDNLLTEHPSDEGLLEDIIEQQIGEGLFEQAETTSDRLITITRDPYQQVMRRMRKGDVLQRAGKRDEALAVYGETLQRVGRETWLERELIAQIAELFHREDNLSALKEHWEQLIEAEPDRLALHKASAKLALDLGDQEHAISAWQRIVEQTPGDRSNREGYIAILARANQLDSAIAQLRTLIAQFPEDAELQIKLAGFLHQAGQAEEATAAIHKYMAKSDRSEYAYLRGARALDGFGQKEAARKVFEECLAAHSDSTTAREAFAAWLYDGDGKSRAIEIWKRLAVGADRNEVVRVTRMLTARKEHQHAFDLLHGRLSELSDDTIYLGQLIDEALSLEKYEETVPWVARRVRLARNANELEGIAPQALRVLGKIENEDSLISLIRADAAKSVSSVCMLSEISELRGDPKGASALLENALAAVTAEPDSETKSGRLEMLGLQRIRLATVRQDWQTAAAAAKSLIELPGGRKTANIRRLVDLYLRDNQYEQALPWAAEWKQVSPGSLMPWIQESQILTRMGRDQDSLRVLRQASRKFPNDVDLASMLAEKLVEVGQYKEAERIYWRHHEQSQDLNDRLRWIERLAQLSRQTYKSAELIKTLEERRRGNPESIEPLLSLAIVHRFQSNYEERRAVLLEATRKQPDHLSLLLEIARMDESEGEWEKALETLEMALPLDPTDRVKQQIAKICLQHHQTERGLALLTEIAGGDEADPREIETIVDALTASEEWERARDFLAPHAARLPDDWRLQYLRAVIEKELGETELAKSLFVDLLSAEGVLPGTAPVVQGHAHYFVDSFWLIPEGLPPGFVQVQQIAADSEEALSNELDRGHRWYSGYGHFSMTSNRIAFPVDAQQCRTFAICHLIQFVDEMADEQRLELVRVLARHGVSEAELVVVINPTDESFRLLYDELLGKFPDNETLLALVVMEGWTNRSVGPESLLMAKAYEKFKSSYPTLAFLPAINLAITESDSSMLIEAIEIAERTDLTNGHMVEGMGRLCHHLESSGESVPPELKIRVNQILRRWHANMPSTGRSDISDFLYYHVFASMLSDAPPEQFLSFLEEELERQVRNRTGDNAATPSVSRFVGYLHPGYYHENPIQLLPCPPNQWNEFSDELATRFFKAFDRTVSHSGSNKVAISDKDWVERYAPAVGNVKHPILQAILQLQTGLSMERLNPDGGANAFEPLRETLKPMIEAERPNLDAILMAATLATHEKKWAEASQILEQAYSLPMKQEMRKVIDSALVALAIDDEVDNLEDPEYAKQLGAAQSAALRMRRYGLNVEQQRVLLVAMERLELNEEAERLESSLASKKSPSRRQVHSNYRQAAEPVDRVAELVDQGNRAGAVALLTQEFNVMARLAISDVRNISIRHDWEDFLEKVDSSRLKTELLAQLDDDYAKSSSRLAYRGLAHELLGERATAIEWYQKALDTNARQSAVRLRLLKLQFNNNPNQIAVLLAGVPRRERDEFIQSLLEYIEEDYEEFGLEKRLAILDHLVTFAESISDGSKPSPDWLKVTLALIARGSDIDIQGELPFLAAADEDRTSIKRLMHVPFVYSPNQQAKRELPETFAEEEVAQAMDRIVDRVNAAIARRRSIHDRIVAVMRKSPEEAPEAFTAWLAACEAAGEMPGDEAVQFARQAVIDYKPPRNRKSSYRDPRRGDDEKQIVKKKTPVEFLARHYGWAADDRGSAEIQFLVDAMKDNRNVQEAHLLNELYQLYAAPEQEFVRIAEKVLLAHSQREYEFQVAPSNAFDIWRDRKLTVDLAPLLLDRLSQMIGQSQMRVSETEVVVGDYLKSLSDGDRMEEVKSFLDAASVRFIGPHDEQSAILAKLEAANPSGIYSKLDAEQHRFRIYTNLLSRCLANRKLILCSLHELHRVGRLTEQDCRTAAGTIMKWLNDKDRFEEAMAWLNDSPFLSGVSDFQPYPVSVSVPEASWGISVWGKFLLDNNWLDPTPRKRLLQELSSRENPTFGERILLLALNGSLTQKAVYDALGADLHALQNLDREQKLVLADFIRELQSHRHAFGENRGQHTSQGRQAANILTAAQIFEVDSLTREQIFSALQLQHKPQSVEAEKKRTNLFTGREREEYPSEIRYRSNGERLDYVWDTSKHSEAFSHSVQEGIYWKGELVRLIESHPTEEHWRLYGGPRIHRQLMFESPNANPNVRPRPGDIVGGANCPVIGCIDGAFLDDYFPNTPKTVIERQGDKVALRSTTEYGVASCVLDSQREYLPIELEIIKSPDHLTSGGRVLKTVKFDVDEPSSSLTRKRIVLKDVVIQEDSSGRFFIGSGKLEEEITSERSVEGTVIYEWKVKSVDYSPKYGGVIRPEVSIAMGEDFWANAVEELPFVWSPDDNWVIPWPHD